MGPDPFEELTAAVDELAALTRRRRRTPAAERADLDARVALLQARVTTLAASLDDGDEDDEAEVDEEEEWADDDGDDEELGVGPWSPRRDWARFAPSRPLPVEHGVVARSRRGAIGETWWSQRFLSSLERAGLGGRLARGRSYARAGQVVELSVAAGAIRARVQGSRPTPYRVAVRLAPVGRAQWDRIVDGFAAEAGHAARLLSGELPHEAEEVFAAAGATLFPAVGTGLRTECSCPDWANPCKHVAAVCYLAAEAFDRDPFLLLAWRGREREQLLTELRRRRGTAAPRAGADPPAPAPAPDPPSLDEELVGFWKAGPGLADLRLRPGAAADPAALVRSLPRGLVEVGGAEAADLLDPLYAAFAAAAAARALEPG
jgi:uncharacterized Zn finger protein